MKMMVKMEGTGRVVMRGVDANDANDDDGDDDNDEYDDGVDDESSRK